MKSAVTIKVSSLVSNQCTLLLREAIINISMWWKIALQKSKDKKSAAADEKPAAAALPAKKGMCVCVCVYVCVCVCTMLNELFLLHSCLSFSLLCL